MDKISILNSMCILDLLKVPYLIGRYALSWRPHVKWIVLTACLEKAIRLILCALLIKEDLDVICCQ